MYYHLLGFILQEFDQYPAIYMQLQLLMAQIHASVGV